MSTTNEIIINAGKEILQNIYDNIKEMFIVRGYNGFYIFKSGRNIQQPETIDETFFENTTMYKFMYLCEDETNGNKLQTLIYMHNLIQNERQIKMDKSQFILYYNNYIQYLKEGYNNTMMIIINSNTPNIQRVENTIFNESAIHGIDVEFFNDNFFKFNLLKHKYQPRYIKIHRKENPETRTLLIQLRTEGRRLPCVYVTDPVCRYFKARVDDYMEYHCTSESSGLIIKIRKVIASDI